VLPGGQPGATNLLNHEELREKILEYNKAKKYLAAICAAPMVLGAHGVLTGKKATIYPGMEGHLKDGEYQDHPVVWDDHLITSKGPGTAMDFALTLIQVLVGKDMAEKVRAELLL
jgi:4-methyl-5(b-hydroxyethyl)-thiazole monophosphate biosynthesis